jgi:transcriptional regulator with XRE-family HTH domain
MLDMRKIGVYISGLRKQKDITQLELADIMNISHQAVSKWERGESMPDIVMLPKIAETFGKSIDEILSGGEIAGNRYSAEASIINEVLEHKTHKVVDMVNKGDIDLQAVAEVAPILKPSTIGEIVRGISSISLDHICALAPFLDQSDLEKLIHQVEIGNIPGKVLEELAPFVSSGTIDQLVDKALEGSIDAELLASIAPFISRQKLEQLVENITDDNVHQELLEEIAPFLSSVSLERLVDRVVDGEVRVETIIELAPFLGQEGLRKLVAGVKAGQMNADVLSKLAPFLSRSAMSEMISDIITNSKK